MATLMENASGKVERGKVESNLKTQSKHIDSVAVASKCNKSPYSHEKNHANSIIYL